MITAGWAAEKFLMGAGAGFGLVSMLCDRPLTPAALTFMSGVGAGVGAMIALSAVEAIGRVLVRFVRRHCARGGS